MRLLQSKVVRKRKPVSSNSVTDRAIAPSARMLERYCRPGSLALTSTKGAFKDVAYR